MRAAVPEVVSSTKVKFPIAVYVLIGAGIAAFVIAWANPGIYQPYWEGEDYFRMAQGRPETAYYYYAGRVLHPYVVRILANATGLDLHRAFLDVAGISLLALCVLLACHIRRCNLHPALLIPMLSVPATVALYTQYYVQDLFHATLVAAFFLVYSYSAWAALPVLLLLHLTRESTILLSAWLVVLSLRRRDWTYALGALAIAALGISITSAAVHAALPNKHGLGTIATDALKIPYGFCYNVLGLVFWTDTNAASLNYTPIWTVNVAGHLGSIRQIGFCGFRPRLILETLAGFIVPFGVQPAIAVRLVRDHWRALPRYNKVLQTAFAYGAMCLALSPLIGVNPARYFLYAWPLYWLVVPELLRGMKFNRTWVVVLLSLNTAASFIGFYPIGSPRYSEPLSVAALLILNALAYRWMPKLLVAGEVAETQRDVAATKTVSSNE